jgi:hydrogenase maturation protein HypF
MGKPIVAVQHHLAHVVACMVDNDVAAPCLGVAWDGTGFGADGTIWGGEFLAIDGTRARRVAHLLPFPLPGGDAAARDPRRSALGALFETCGVHALSMLDIPALAALPDVDRAQLGAMLERKLRCPRTSSAGRLFDAAAAILGVCTRASFEGQAAMALEFRAGSEPAPAWEVSIERAGGAGPWVVDWRPMLVALVRELRSGVATDVLSARVHATFAAVVGAVALRVGLRRVLLTGGCFQNRRLLESSIHELERHGFLPYWHRQVPPNDGGVSLGQLVAATRGIELREESD